MIKHTANKAISFVLAILFVSSVVFLASCNKKEEEEEWVQYCYCEKCYEEARAQFDAEEKAAVDDLTNKSDLFNQASEAYEKSYSKEDEEAYNNALEELNAAVEYVKNNYVKFDYANYLRPLHN